MKKLLSYEKDMGADGGKAAAVLGIDGDQLKASVEVSYPLAKVVEPVEKAVGDLLDKLEKAIPGDWDKPIVAQAKADFKVELLKRLSESAA